MCALKSWVQLRMARFVFLIFCLLFPALALVGGIVTVTGSESEWVILGGESGWVGTAKEPVVEFTATGESELILGFYLFHPNAEREVREISVVLTEDPSAGSFVTVGHGEGAGLIINDSKLLGSALTIRGTFQADLVFTADFGMTLDLENTRHVEGSFDVVLTGP